MDVKEKIKSLLENDINDLGYIIWGLEISGNSSSKLVRLFIDKTNGNIDLFDCEKVSNCLLYTSPSPRDSNLSRMPSSA